MNAADAINELHAMTDKIDGYFLVGTNTRREVVINCENVTTDDKGRCHFVLSPRQAIAFARVLLKKAREAHDQ